MNASLSAGFTEFWSGRRVAVTGATGFVGYHVALLLAEFGADVAALVRPTSNCERLLAAGVACVSAPLADVDALARGCDGRALVFHIAGAVDFEGDWDRFHQANVVGTHNVLLAARRAGVRRVVHTSSIVAVGATRRPHVQDETSPWTLDSLRIPYVTTKRQAQELALAAAKPDLDVVVVNPASVVGPGDYSRSEFGTLCRRFWRGRIPLYFGGGNNYVDVRDVALGHLLAARHGRSGERYLLSGANRASAAFFTDLARAAGRPIFRVRAPRPLAYAIAWLDAMLRRSSSRAYLTPSQVKLLPFYFYFDCAKAQRELGYTPRPLQESLRDAYQFWTPEDRSQATVGG